MRIAIALALLWVGLAGARLEAALAAERWAQMGEEERHQMTRAEEYFQRGDCKSAKAEYELYLQLYPKSGEASFAQLMFAECTRRLGGVNAAVAEFQAVLDYFPDSPDAADAVFCIGMCRQQSGDVEPAVEMFAQAIAKWPKSSAAARAHQQLVEIYNRTRRGEQAVACLRFLATGEYQDVDRIREWGIRGYFACLIAEAKLAEAHELVARNFKDDTLVRLAHWTAEDMGRVAEKKRPAFAAAAAAFIDQKLAEKADPRQADVEDGVACIWASAGLKDKALAAFAAMLAKYPDHDGIRCHYGDYLRDLKRPDEARAVYRGMKDTWQGDWRIAESFVNDHDFNAAIEHLKGCVGKYPDNAGRIQWRLGELLAETGKYAEAVAAYQAAQSEPQSLFRIAGCQGAMGKHDDAIQTLVGVMNFFKDNAADALLEIAHHHAAKGDEKTAISTLKKVCKNYLNTGAAAAAHQELSQKYGVEVTLGGAAKKEDE